MSARATRTVLVLGLLVVLGAVDSSIYSKERVIRGGETIFVELAPVDPRSLMQGDYMALRFRLAEQIETWRDVEQETRARSTQLTLDDRGVAIHTPGGGSVRIAYRIRGGRVWLGTNAYFFEEGTADRYTGARYGEFRVDPTSGEAVLVGLRDEELNPL